MNDTIKISGVIITYNEEHNLEDCLVSLQGVVDEIVVVDSFSTDSTESIARQYQAKFIQNAFEGHIQQKNFAMTQAKHDWVLSLDADERLSEKLKQAILKLKAEGLQADGYRFNRLNNYCGQWIKHAGWYPDSKIRLWNRQKGQWGGVNPHDTVIMKEETKVEQLKLDILHYTYRKMEDHITQMNKFSTIAANEDFKKGKKSHVFIHLILYPWLNFFKNYIIRLGFLDGYGGFLVCKNGAYYRFLKYAKLRNLHQNKTI